MSRSVMSHGLLWYSFLEFFSIVHQRSRHMPLTCDGWLIFAHVVNGDLLVVVEHMFVEIYVGWQMFFVSHFCLVQNVWKL